MMISYLKSCDLTIEFDNGSGLPTKYTMRNGAVFTGAFCREGVTVRVCRLRPRIYENIMAAPVRIEQGMSEIIFSFDVIREEAAVVKFRIRYILNNSSLMVNLEEVGEYDGFELIHVELPTLVSIEDVTGTEWLAHTQSAGSTVRLRDARPGSFGEDPYFGKIMSILPLVMFGSKNGACVMEVTSWMDGTLFRVEEGNVKKCAAMGTVKQWRVDGSGCCNTNDDQLRVACGNENTPNLHVEQKSNCRIDFTGDYDSNGRIDWVDCARLVHDRMPRIRTDYYDKHWCYIIGCDNPANDKPTLTFPEVAGHIAKVAALIDYFPQTVYLAGWQFDGHDSGYPSVDVIGNRIGGYEEYLKLKEVGLKINVNVSLDDNYDDAYIGSPEYNQDYIAHLPDGTLWKSRTWTRDTSCIIGLAKYMKEEGRKRVHKTSRRYLLKDSVLVDVLSWFAIRNDWDREKPASGVRNFLEGRCRVHEEYMKDGIDVISEFLRYPWVGRMNLVVDGPGDTSCPFGGVPAPIVALVYRNAILHGCDGGAGWGKRLFLNGFNVNWFPTFDQRTDSQQSSHMNCAMHFYLSAVPAFKLRRLEMVDYIYRDGIGIITLEQNSRIEVNIKDWSYRAFWRGNEITGNGSVYCPLDKDRIAFYSINSETLKYPVPQDWTAEKVKARALTESGAEEWTAEVRDGFIFVDVRSHVPVIVNLR